MKYRSRDVIASIKNSAGIRVFIPEKLRVDGQKGVRPYFFWRIGVSAQPLLISGGTQVNLPLQIAVDSTSVTVPFTRDLLNYYYRAAARNMANVSYRKMVARISNTPIIPPPAETMNPKEKEGVQIERILQGTHKFTEE